MKKRVLSCLIVGIVSMGLVVGCGKDTGAGKDDKAHDEKVTITFMRTGTPEVLRDIFKPIIANFEKEYPNIKVNMEDLGWGDAEKKLQVMASSQTLPDVMYHLPGNIFDMADKGLVEDLTSYMDDKIKKDIYPTFLSSGQYKGKQYVIPSAGSTLMLWYNTELFEQAGLDPNSPPKTWDEFLEAAGAIEENTEANGVGVYGKTSGGETSFVFESLFASAVNGKTWNENVYTYEKNENREAALDTLKFMQKMADYSQGNVEEFGRFDTRTLLRDGKVGMVLDLINMENQITEGLESGKYKVAQLPARAGGAQMSALNVGGFFIPTNSKHKEEAWTFLRYLMDTENQKAHSAYGSVPILKSEAATYDEGDTNEMAIIKSVEESVPEGICPKINSLWDTTGEELQLLLMQKQDAESTLDNIKAKHKKIYDK